MSLFTNNAANVSQSLLKITLSIIIIGSTFQFGRAQLALDSTTLSVTTVAEGLDTPWEILWGPDDKIWLTERGGRVSRLDPRIGVVEQLIEIEEVVEQGESGLLGMALHPNFVHPDSQFVYLVYTYNAPERTEKLVRYTFRDNVLQDPFTLLDGIPAANIHDGSRVVITPGRKILMTTGDAANTSLSQNTNSLAGKILRLNLDGSIPEDNPLTDSPVWTIGHRNPQGLVLSSAGIVYSSEHGPANDDEINIIAKGANYGWPDVQGYCNTAGEQNFCSANDIAEPISAWTPTLAVAGLDYYGHEAIPEWQHALLLTTLKEDDFRVLRLNNDGRAIIDEKVYFNNEYGRLRDVCVSPSGDIYFSTSNRDGRANNGFPITADDRIIRLSNDLYTVVTGIERDPGTGEGFTIYPNPAGTRIRLTGQPGSRIAIHDLSSRKIMEMPYQRAIDVSGFRPGTYVISVSSADTFRKAKLIKY